MIHRLLLSSLSSHYHHFLPFLSIFVLGYAAVLQSEFWWAFRTIVHWAIYSAPVTLIDCGVMFLLLCLCTCLCLYLIGYRHRVLVLGT